MGTASTTERGLHIADPELRRQAGIAAGVVRRLAGLSDTQLRYLEGRLDERAPALTDCGDNMVAYSLGMLAVALDRCMDLDAAWAAYNPTALFGLPPHDRQRMLTLARKLLKERAA